MLGHEGKSNETEEEMPDAENTGREETALGRSGIRSSITDQRIT